MNNFFKYLCIGFAGYLVGFYEYKYKANMALIEVLLEKEKEEKTEKDE